MWPSLFLIAALIAGFTTVGILLARTQRLRTDRWLIGVVLVFMGTVCHNLLLQIGVYERDPTLYFLPVIAQLLTGPMLWFYARGMMGREAMSLSMRLLHLLPGILQLSIQVWAFQLDGYPKYRFWSEVYEPWLQPLIFWTGQVLMITYLTITHRALSAWRDAMAGQFSNLDPVALRWLDRLVLMLAALVLVSVTLGMVPDAFSAAVLPTDVLKALIVCAIGWQSLRQVEIKQRDGPAEQASAATPERGMTDTAAGVITAEPEPRPVPFDPLLLERLDQSMMERSLFKQPDLTLFDLAEAAGVSAKRVSSTINAGAGCTFHRYVNRFRIRAMKEALSQGRHDQLSLLGIALDCGFNSKSTFNRVFREEEGLTPSEWLKRIAEGR